MGKNIPRARGLLPYGERQSTSLAAESSYIRVGSKVKQHHQPSATRAASEMLSRPQQHFGDWALFFLVVPAKAMYVRCVKKTRRETPFGLRNRKPLASSAGREKVYLTPSASTRVQVRQPVSFQQRLCYSLDVLCGARI